MAVSLSLEEERNLSALRHNARTRDDWRTNHLLVPGVPGWNVTRKPSIICYNRRNFFPAGKGNDGTC